MRRVTNQDQQGDHSNAQHPECSPPPSSQSSAFSGCVTMGSGN